MKLELKNEIFNLSKYKIFIWFLNLVLGFTAYQWISFYRKKRIRNKMYNRAKKEKEIEGKYQKAVNYFEKLDPKN